MPGQLPIPSSDATGKPGLFILRESVLIHAPIDRCFLLSTSVEIVHQELGMHSVCGRTSGFVCDGDTIRWEGWQLGLPNYHVSQINHYRRPVFFQDRMIAGRFKYFEHDHHLRETSDGTLLQDELRFSMPFGVLGRIVGRWILVPHIKGLMHRRFAKLKNIAETDRWRHYIPEPDESADAVTPFS